MADSNQHSVSPLPSVAECDKRIAQAQDVLDNKGLYDIEVEVQADKDRRRWEFNRRFAERVANLEEQLEAAQTPAWDRVAAKENKRLREQLKVANELDEKHVAQRDELQEQYGTLHTIMCRYFFEEMLPDLDFETERGDPGWHSHPWWGILDITDDECYAALRGSNPASRPADVPGERFGGSPGYPPPHHRADFSPASEPEGT